MKRALPLALLALLTACAREDDAFRPHIVIEQPDAGTVSATGKTVVRGYAFDDRGIARIEVNNQTLFVAPVSAGDPKNKGQRIRRFAFQTSGTQAKLSYLIKVTDSKGLITQRELPITVDTVPPTLEIVKAERMNGVTRISGVVRDNVKVARILVDGVSLEIVPAPSRQFYLEVPQNRVTLTAFDAVGNKVNQTVGPLPDLAPPAPPPSLAPGGGTQLVPAGPSQTQFPRRRRRRAASSAPVQVPGSELPTTP